MYNRIPTPTFNLILLLGAALLICELIFFNAGAIFSMLFFGVLIFVGKKHYKRMIGKILFWAGIIFLILLLLSMVVVRVFLLILIVYFIYIYFTSKHKPDWIKPSFFYDEPDQEGETLIRQEPLFKNRFFGNEKTSEKAYEWQDINIQGGFGNRIVDLSNTVLPDREAVISMRHLAGNITIYVPYEVDVSVHHSSIIGRATIFYQHFDHLFNNVLSFRTEHYADQKMKVKIITSIVTGDLEVKRI